MMLSMISSMSNVLVKLCCVVYIASIWPSVMTAQPATIYMSVLSSQKHQWGNIDNPVIGIFVSTDAGDTWEHIGWRGYIRTFYTEAGSDGTIWAACGNGVLRSDDNGASFVITTGWEVTEVLKVRVHPQSPETVYAATAYGVFKTSDRGETWRKMNNGLPTLPFTSDIIVDRDSRSRIFAATEDGIYISNDAAENWNSLGLEGKGIRVIVQHPRDATVLYAGTEDDGIYRSADGGSTWRQMNNGLSHLTVYTIAINPSDPDVMYLGTHGGGVYRTHSGGERWNQVIHGLTNSDVHSLIVLPDNPETVFAGTLNGGLFRSDDGGDNWEFDSQDGGQVWGLSVVE
jgi:photosystem II stability/assembly factor-like uncharacterized protein